MRLITQRVHLITIPNVTNFIISIFDSSYFIDHRLQKFI